MFFFLVKVLHDEHFVMHMLWLIARPCGAEEDQA